jgi:AcrR family transcriptional regulator
VSARRKTSKASGRDALSERDIVETALRMLQREGARALSMRELAAELRVTPMAIYYHVPHKRALVERITDAVLESVPMPEPSGVHWERELKNVALASWRRLSAYPGLIGAVLDQQPSKTSRKILRYHTTVLLAAGFDVRTAALATTAYNTFVYGVMAGQVQRGKTQHKRKRVHKPSGVENYLDQLDVGVLMEYGLDTLIAGLREPLAAKRDAVAKAKARRVRAQHQPD